jgi:DNA-binding SARP family transcriptional activator
VPAVPEQQSTLTIRVLGPPLVECGQVPLALASQKAQALLYYLAASRQAASRDHLTALLWGESALANARHSLRSSLYKLRQALQQLGVGAALRADDDRLALDWRYAACDLVRYQELLGSGDEASLRAAVGSVRGAFLQGFSLPDALLFDEFAQQQEAQLIRSQRQALDRLASLAEQREDWPQAVADIEALARLDPLDEAVHRRLMELYVRSGSPGLAQRHFQLVERTLGQELGIAPAEETRAALRAAMQQRRSFEPAVARVPFVRARPSTLPFVGRAATLAGLQQLAAQVAAGAGRVVLIEGEAGIGKSRLVDELIGVLQAAPPGGRPWQFLQGRCSPYDSILAYGPFREAFGVYLPGSLDALGDAELPGATRSTRFAEHVLHALGALGRRGPIVLAIDDLHVADQLSLSLFGYLALRLHQLPILLIGTAQDADDAPGLRELLTLGRRRGAIECVRLPALTIDTVQTLLASLCVGNAASRSLAPWLLARSGGNPFVLEALIAQLQAEQLLVPNAGGWQLDDARWISWRAATALPERTFDLVSMRLRGLGPLARQIVDLLAVAGDRLPLALVAAVLEQGPAATQAAIEELLALRLAVEQNDTLALRHELLRDAALHQLSGLARRAAHRQLAAAWESAAGDAARIARHAVAGADLARARRYGLPLLSDLPYAYAGAETVAFLQQLAELVGPSASPEEAYRIAHALGQAHRSLGQVEQAGGCHQRQLAIAQRAGLAEAEAIANFELAELAFVHNDYDAAIAAAHAGLACTARAAPSHKPALVGRGHRLVGTAQAMEGSDLGAAEEHLQAAIASHRRSDDRTNLSAALFELGNVLAQQGAVGHALELYREAADTLREGEAPFLRALAENNLAYHSLLLGRLDDAQRALACGHAFAERHGLSTALLHLFSTESEIHLYTGHWAEAGAAARHGLALAESLENLERQAGYHASLALVAAGQGSFRAAREQLELALGMLAGGTFWHLRTRLLLWLAELCLEHDPDRIGAYLETALTLARTQGRRLLQLRAERLQARYLARRDPAAAQARLVEQLDQVVALDLSLEAARTRAALARVTLQHAPRSSSGHSLFERALRELSAHGARAEAAALRSTRLQLVG